MILAVLQRMLARSVICSAALLLAGGCFEIDTSVDQNVLYESSGEVSLEWLIVDSEGGLISCVDAGATEVEIAILGDVETRERLSCFGGFAVVGPLAPGENLIEVSLIDPDGEPLVTAEVGEVEIPAGSTTPLGAVEFTL
jgi:hypothetical protein